MGCMYEYVYSCTYRYYSNLTHGSLSNGQLVPDARTLGAGTAFGYAVGVMWFKVQLCIYSVVNKYSA
jgi:hypothetical protein